MLEESKEERVACARATVGEGVFPTVGMTVGVVLLEETGEEACGTGRGRAAGRGTREASWLYLSYSQ